MPRFDPTRARQATTAALVLLLASLSGCGAGGLDSAVGHPEPFALSLPTPTNTPGSAPATSAPVPTAAPATPSVAPEGGGDETLTPQATDTPALSATPPPTEQAPPTGTLPAGGDATSTFAAPTRTRAVTLVPADTPTMAPTTAPNATLTPTATPTWTATLPPAPTPTWTSAPTAAPTASLPLPDWDLARDVIGLWEYVEGDWRYSFDFFPDRRVSISGNGIRTYQVRDPRTLVIQMLEEEWVIPVVDLTHDHLTLQGVINQVDQFTRVEGTSDLDRALVGLWLDTSGEFPSFDFTEDGVVVSEFGRGRYQVASPNSVLITCDEPETCVGYLAYGQPNDAPFAVRIYQVDDSALSLQGLGYGQVWTLDRHDGYSNLATGLLGRWVDDSGASVEFTEGGDWIVDDDLYGSYEVLSDSTIWGVLEGVGQALVITELTGNRLKYAEWGYFYKQDQRVYTRDPNSP
jgi:hypothetical protein